MSKPYTFSGYFKNTLHKSINLIILDILFVYDHFEFNPLFNMIVNIINLILKLIFYLFSFIYFDMFLVRYVVFFKFSILNSQLIWNLFNFLVFNNIFDFLYIAVNQGLEIWYWFALVKSYRTESLINSDFSVLLNEFQHSF